MSILIVRYYRILPGLLPRIVDLGESIFDRVCHEHEIEHRLTKVNHPWTNGQVERMNRTLKEATVKEATVKRYYYENHRQLREHLHNFLNAYNFAKRLKALQGLTPYEYIINCWQKSQNDLRSTQPITHWDCTSKSSYHLALKSLPKNLG